MMPPRRDHHPAVQMVQSTVQWGGRTPKEGGRELDAAAGTRCRHSLFDRNWSGARNRRGVIRQRRVSRAGPR
jgi:hypothetical protein